MSSISVKKKTRVGRILVMVAVFSALFIIVHGSRSRSAPMAATDQLQMLVDKDAIRTLIMDYSRDLDARNWDALVQLFAKDGGTLEGATGVAVGREAIKDMMVKAMGTASNGDGVSLDNLHLLTNEMINVDGDHATALTKWVFVMAGADKGPAPVLIGHYADDLVREDGAWKFKRREIKVDMARPNALPKKD